MQAVSRIVELAFKDRPRQVERHLSREELTALLAVAYELGLTDGMADAVRHEARKLVRKGGAR
jgi:hypothetical protein